MKKVAVLLLLSTFNLGGASGESIFSGDFEAGQLLTWSDMVAPCVIPAGAGLEDVSNPTTVVGTGTPASCTPVRSSTPWRRAASSPSTAARPGDHHARRDGQGIQRHRARDRHRRRGAGHPQRRRHPPHPLHEHLRPGPGVDHVPLPEPGPPAAHRAEPHLHRRRLQERDRVRRRWRHLGARRPVQGRQHPLLQQLCAPKGPDVGGAAVRVFSQYNGLPVYVVNTTFGGAAGFGGACSNGGGISSIGVSWTIINSLFSYNHAIGNGGNPARSGTPGGGSGGAIYNDGNTMTLSLCGTRIEYNEVNAHGSAIFFVTNDHTGNIVIDRSVITNNIGGSWYPTYPQISNHDDTPIDVRTRSSSRVPHGRCRDGYWFRLFAGSARPGRRSAGQRRHCQIGSSLLLSSMRRSCEPSADAAHRPARYPLSY